MAVLIFRLRGVPDDEAEDIRALLQAHHFDFYETPPGNWGISMPALWLRDDADAERARELIADYQQERSRKSREAYEALKRQGKQPTLWKKFLSGPLRFIFYLAGILAVLYLSTMPFIGKA